MALWSSEALIIHPCPVDAYHYCSRPLTSCLSEDSETFSAGDEEDLFGPLILLPNFSMDPCPTDDTPFQPLNTAKTAARSWLTAICLQTPTPTVDDVAPRASPALVASNRLHSQAAGDCHALH